ncbi:MAG: fructose PTS transporter subunit IIA [[Lactobacillus] timonensis]|jgi:PTS system fructose-specific IIA component|uniref:PTS sugar transporter subunit IIA n=1 Tax=[Lactobacillus] timonensis TaxID=1970790 RepID=UPI00235377B7|nr:PTS sugar transporter subunit IIA [[Lactobacillus] timonensis]MCI1925409.1 fructose PTS transporter subunit IIA [[Lactobacillus] timonensis]MCI1956839.1 fructose PTS transporter subunit IIA [[Lactobacillus] timonensis]MCI1969829.1 fructose PTS transporter subunit IIA [[Lactobacillus] timonensis]MCI2005958.1 fructose PTS transporter subunit IIA [[Lactobacillus] timonensis]
MDQMDVKNIVSILPVFGIDASDKDEALTQMIKALKHRDYITDETGFKDDIYHREKEMATYIGHGIGLPHSQSKYVTHPTVVVGRLNQPIVWSGDDQVTLIFMIAVPREARGNLHLKILANLSRMLIHDDFREQLATASPEQVIAMMDRHMVRSNVNG